MKVPFLDLKLINSKHKEILTKAFEDTLDSGWYILGEQVKKFEQEFSAYTGAQETLGVANGLDALNLILRGYKELGKLKDGDEVAVPANTYIATILAILENDLKPLLIEPDPKTFNIDPIELNKHISTKTKAVMIVHLYGRACQMDQISDLCKSKNLLLIEDCAQSQGATFNGKMTGNWGHASGFSFYPGKNLGALGDAGAITTNDADLADILKYLRNYGSKVKYENKYIGVNSRLDEMQAAFLRQKLTFLNKENAERNAIANQYLKGINNNNIQLPSSSKDGQNVWHVFPVISKERDELRSFLSSQQIETVIHYPIPPHKQNALKEFNTLSLPRTEKIHNEILSLPLFPYMHQEQIQKVIETVNKFRD